MPELIHTFRLPVALPRAWTALDDPAWVAGAFPGASPVDAGREGVSGQLAVKVGPVTARYEGTVTVTLRDRPRRRFGVAVEALEVGGVGRLEATLQIVLAAVPDQDATSVEVRTDLLITGRVAQFGDGVLSDVLDGMFSELAGALEAAGFPEAPELELDPLDPSLDAPRAEPRFDASLAPLRETDPEPVRFGAVAETSGTAAAPAAGSDTSPPPPPPPPPPSSRLPPPPPPPPAPTAEPAAQDAPAPDAPAPADPVPVEPAVPTATDTAEPAVPTEVLSWPPTRTEPEPELAWPTSGSSLAVPATSEGSAAEAPGEPTVSSTPTPPSPPVPPTPVVRPDPLPRPKPTVRLTPKRRPAPALPPAPEPRTLPSEPPAAWVPSERVPADEERVDGPPPTLPPGIPAPPQPVVTPNPVLPDPPSRPADVGGDTDDAAAPAPPAQPPVTSGSGRIDVLPPARDDPSLAAKAAPYALVVVILWLLRRMFGSDDR